MIRLENITVQYKKKDLHDKYLKNFILNSIIKNRSSFETVDEYKFHSALKNININFYPGDRVAFVGKNGSGKTTFLKVLSGEIPPSNGCIKNKYDHVSFIDPKSGMDDMATGLENTMMKFFNNFINPNTDIIHNVKEFSELGDFFYQPIHTYSAGMKMRLAFSILVNIKKPVAIMDEWMSVGDIDFKAKATEKLKFFLGKRKFFFLATHSIDMAKAVCNKIITLENGEIKNVQELS